MRMYMYICSGNVTLGPVLRQTRQRLVGDNPKILVDMAHVYCVACQTFIGWRIVSIYFYIILYSHHNIFYIIKYLTVKNLTFYHGKKV